MMVPKRHDHTAKTIFGVTRNFDAAGFCDTVLAQPKSPQYVAGRLWQQLASDTPPSPQALDRLVAAYGPAPQLAGVDATRSSPTTNSSAAGRPSSTRRSSGWSG